MKKVGKENFLPNHAGDNFKAGTFAPIIPLLQKIREGKMEKEIDWDKFLEKSCKKKVHFSKKDAQTRRNELNKEGKRVREYHCHRCNSWHLTHKERYNFN